MTTPKHPYNPGWSWGNVLSALAIIVPMALGGAGIYAVLRVDSARAEEKIVTLDAKVSEVKAQTDTRFSKLETKVEKLSEKTEDMALTQAQMAANLELLLRSQGLRPVSVDTIRRSREND